MTNSINLYDNGYKASMNQIKNISGTFSLTSKVLNYAGYIDGVSKLYNGNLALGTHSILNNSASIEIGAALG